MGIGRDSLRDVGTLRNIRIESLVTEPEVVTYNDDGTVATYDPGGETGMVIDALGEVVNTKFGDLTMVLHTLIKNGFQVGIGADGLWYFGRANWYGGADGIIGRNDAGEIQIQLYTDGSILGAGGRLVIGLNAMQLTDLLYSITHTAENGGQIRTMRYGMGLIPGGTTPAGEILFNSEPGSELTTNGGFETSTLDDWNKTTETNGAWSENTDPAFVRSGSKSAKWLPTSTTSTGVLTSDRIACTAGNAHEITGYFYFAPTQIGYATKKAELKWYDDASAGNLLRTDPLVPSNATGQWNKVEGTYPAPVGALSFAIVVTLINPTTNLTAVYLDDFSVAVVSVSRSIRFLPEITFGGGFVQIQESSVPSDATDEHGALGFSTAGTPTAVNDSAMVWGLGGVHYPRRAFQNDTSKRTIYTTTIPANALSTRGLIDVRLTGWVENATGSSQTFTLTVDYGATTVLTAATPNITSSVNAHIWFADIRMWNDGSDAFQIVDARIRLSSPVAVNAFIADDWIRSARGTATEDSTTDLTFTIGITLSTASNSYDFLAGSSVGTGPHALS